MTTTSSFLYKKVVDKSTLLQGISIPAKYQPIFVQLNGGMLVHGNSTKIKILINGELYDAEWKNQPFNQDKFAGHVDVMQFRYSENSPIALKLCQIFQSTYKYVQVALNDSKRHSKQVIKIPKELEEYIIISATSQPDVFVFDCITNADQVEVQKEVENISEESFEEWIGPIQDKTSGYTYSSSLHKVRKLDHSIGESLKRLYDYRCQVTGEKVGDQYAVEVVEAHHINPFTKSMNNDTDNIIILSPSFHRIVHKAKPVFDYKKLSFVFPNGVIAKVILNKHLP